MPILFLESKTLRRSVDLSHRIALLDALQQKDLTPLIRSARRNCFEYLAVPEENIAELESAMATWMESTSSEVYIHGDAFCLADHVFFLMFDSSQSEDAPQVRAGIVYESTTPEPFRKLDSFCHDVREALAAVCGESESERGIPNWEQGPPAIPEGFKRFIARQEVDSLYTSLRKETMSRRILAASNLEHQEARDFLRSAREAHMEGYAARLLPGETQSSEFSIEGLENVGLVEREVQVSCRKTGHALFRLPNAQALAVVTVSDATCSECGSRVSDEKVEEVIAPTQLASSLLEDGSWLVNRLHYTLRQLGVPESEIAVGPSEGTGYGQMMANICGDSFLLVTRDGDVTPAFARWAIDLELETEASHLVVVGTGRLFNEAALLLQNHARRRVSAGHDFALVVADDITTATKELAAAVEAVSQRIVADHLCRLDNSVGLNVSRLLLTKFKLTTKTIVDDAELIVPSPAVPKPPLALAASVSSYASNVIESEPVYATAEPVTSEPFLAEPLTSESFLAEPDASEPFDAEPVASEPDRPPIDQEPQVRSDIYPAWDQL